MSRSANAAELGIITLAGEPRLLGDLFKRPIATIAIEDVCFETGDEQIGVAVIVVIAGRHTHSVPMPAHDPRQARRIGHVIERRVTPVPKESITVGRSGVMGVAQRDDDPPLNAVNIKPAIAVEVEQRHTAGIGFRKQETGRMAIIEKEAKARFFGVVDERGVLAITPWLVDPGH